MFLACGAEVCSLVYDSYISLAFWPECIDAKMVFANVVRMLKNRFSGDLSIEVSIYNKL